VSESEKPGASRLRIVAIEPYFGGSHERFLRAYAARSRHEVLLATLPARKWKWRMRGGAVYFSELLPGMLRGGEVLLASDFLNLAELLGLLGRPVRSVLYFHENQLTYPVRYESERDYQFALTNITSALAAGRVVFNSDFHRSDFLSAASSLLERVPDHPPAAAIRSIRERSAVIYPGIHVPEKVSPRKAEGEPLILWNHRWEFDKNPEEFFAALDEVERAHGRFRLAVTGPSFREVPPVFDEARSRFAPHIVHFGFAREAEYRSLLDRADVVVSTASQEFFGMSIAEAVAAGCWPLVPARLSYPELIPHKFHDRCLYVGRADLVGKLLELCRGAPREGADELRRSMERFSFEATAKALDDLTESLAGPPKSLSD